jgi:hypothetical protein
MVQLVCQRQMATQHVAAREVQQEMGDDLTADDEAQESEDPALTPQDREGDDSAEGRSCAERHRVDTAFNLHVTRSGRSDGRNTEDHRPDRTDRPGTGV